MRRHWYRSEISPDHHPQSRNRHGATLWSSIIFSAYSEVAAFGGKLDLLTNSSAPLQLLAQLKGAPWLAPLLTLGAVVSFFCLHARLRHRCRAHGAPVQFARHSAHPSQPGASHQSNAARCDLRVRCCDLTARSVANDKAYECFRSLWLAGHHCHVWFRDRIFVGCTGCADPVKA